MKLNRDMCRVVSERKGSGLWTVQTEQHEQGWIRTSCPRRLVHTQLRCAAAVQMCPSRSLAAQVAAAEAAGGRGQSIDHRRRAQTPREAAAPVVPQRVQLHAGRGLGSGPDGARVDAGGGRGGELRPPAGAGP